MPCRASRPSAGEPSLPPPAADRARAGLAGATSTALGKALLIAGLALCLTSPSLAAPATNAGLPSRNVAWVSAGNDAEIDRAFAQARAQGKPLLLYWGASWCPPCNQLKATLFNRQDFASQSKSFVAVHVDGDRPGAQKLGSRFKVSGYPTVVLFSADARELTRLPGEVDAEQVMQLLQLGLSGGRPIKSVLADALAGKPLTEGEWRVLAFYSWETGGDQLVPKAELGSTLGQLALAVPPAQAETATRLWLKALAASDDGKGIKGDSPLRERVLALLANAARSRAHADVLSGSAAEIVRALAADAEGERKPVLAAFEAALVRLQADGTLSQGDRLGALTARIGLARLDLPKSAVQVSLPASLTQEVRARTAQLDRELTDPYERQALIPTAAWALGQVGLWAESESLLLGNLARSHSPYYLMSQLGSNARKLGRSDEALRWYRQAFETSKGPATRLQWGNGYLSALVDLAPQDAARIEGLARQLFQEAAQDSGAFFERSGRSLQRAGQKLKAWNKDGRHKAELARLQAELERTCRKLSGPQKATCRAILGDAPPSA
jgi:thioredoxin-related protein/tetratricopeptide (TPR) repeat protein